MSGPEAPVGRPAVAEIRIAAPPERVFQFLIDPERVARWLDPPQAWDAQPRGDLRLAVGGVHPVAGQFVAVEPPRRIVFTWGWTLPEYGVPPGGSTVEIELRPDGAGTHVIVRHHGLPGDPDEHAEGWAPTLRRLAEAATIPESTEDMMSGRAHTLAQTFQESLAELANVIEGTNDAEWRQTCAAERWPVAVTAHHVVSSSEPLMGFVELVANGQPLPPITMEMIDERNAKHAEEYANCTREETLELLRTDGASTVARIRPLTDEQLDRTAAIPLMGGADISAQTLIEMLLIGHIAEHGGSIKATLGR